MTGSAHDAPTEPTASVRLRVAMYGIAGLLLLGAVIVQFVAPEGASVTIPGRRYGRGQSEVGLWALYLPFGLALWAAWYATARLPRQRLGRQRPRWLLFLALGPAACFAILAAETLTP